MRTIDTAIMARLEAKELRLFILIDMDVDGTHHRYTDCDVPLVAGGYTYAPRGMKLEPVRYSMSTVVDSVKLKIDNLDDQFTAMFVDGTPQGSEVTVQVALVEKWGEVDDETGATWGPAVHGISMVDGGAFIAASGVDLSSYAGTEGSSTPYLITMHDSSGMTARGYIGAADAGETLGSEIMTDGDCEAAVPTFDEDTDGSCTTAVSNEQAKAGAKSTKVIGDGTQTYFYRWYRATTTAKVQVGKLYKVSV